MFGEKLVFPLLLYQDDFETNNPSGSHRGLGKVGAIYIVVPRLPPHIFSKTENIFLLALYKSSDAALVPLKKLFEKLVQELLFLEQEGICISTSSGEFHIHFSLAGMIGDNLAVHTIMGFVRGFTANYPCKFCFVHSKDLNSTSRISQCKMRTEDIHASQIARNDPYSRGVVGQSALIGLESSSTLRLVNVNLIHDKFEGV